MPDGPTTEDDDLSANPHTAPSHGLQIGPKLWDVRSSDAESTFQEAARSEGGSAYLVPLHIILETSTTFSTIWMSRRATIMIFQGKQSRKISATGYTIKGWRVLRCHMLLQDKYIRHYWTSGVELTVSQATWLIKRRSHTAQKGCSTLELLICWCNASLLRNVLLQWRQTGIGRRELEEEVDL